MRQMSTTATSKAQAPITRTDADGFTVLLCRTCAQRGHDSILNRIKNWRHGLIIEVKCRKCGQMHEYNPPKEQNKLDSRLRGNDTARMTG